MSCFARPSIEGLIDRLICFCIPTDARVVSTQVLSANEQNGYVGFGVGDEERIEKEDVK